MSDDAHFLDTVVMQGMSPRLLREQGCIPAINVQPHSNDMHFIRPMQGVDAQSQNDMAKHT